MSTSRRKSLFVSLFVSLIFLTSIFGFAEEYPNPYVLSNELVYAHDLRKVFDSLQTIDQQMYYLIFELSKPWASSVFPGRWGSYLKETYTGRELAQALSESLKILSQKILNKEVSWWEAYGQIFTSGEIHPRDILESAKKTDIEVINLKDTFEDVSSSYIKRFGRIDMFTLYCESTKELLNSDYDVLWNLRSDSYFGEMFYTKYTKKGLIISEIQDRFIFPGFEGIVVSSEELGKEQYNKQIEYYNEQQELIKNR